MARVMKGKTQRTGSFTILMRLLRLVTPFWRWILASVFLGVLTIGSSVALMASSSFIIAKAALQPSIADLGLVIVGVRLFGITRGIFRYLERLVSHETTFRLLSKLRVWFYTALEPLAPAHLTRFRSGDLLARIMADIETLEHFYLRVIAPPLTAIIVAGGVAVFMTAFDAKIGLVALIFLLLAGAIAPVLTHIIARRVGSRSVETRAELDVAALDGIQGISELLAYGRADDHMAHLRDINRQIGHEQRFMARVTALNGSLHLLMIGAAVMAVLLAAIPLVEAGSMDPIHLTVVALVMMASFESVQAMPLALQFLSESLAAGVRLFEVADMPSTITEIETAQPVNTDAPEIRFEDVHFRYDADESPALDGVTFTLNAGERIAIVGPSGAGKSTLVNLLLRFWDIESGSIHVGEQDIRTYAPAQVRDLFGVVTQHTYLFNTTIRENILIGQRNADTAAMIAAAKTAQIHEFIESLPDGYDTFVGEQGHKLSAGERQRIAIARALLKDAPFLLLDEATANLDSVTEQDVQAAIGQLMQGRTTLIITHQLAGLDLLVNRVLVMRGGRIAEEGTHDDLMAQGGIYRRLWQIQHRRIAVA